MSEENREESREETVPVRSAEGALEQPSIFATIGLVAGVLGITAILFGAVLYALDPRVWNLTVGNTAFGVIAIVIYVVTNKKSLARALGGRSSPLALFEILMIIGVIAGMVTINYFASQSPKEWDLTSDGLYTLHEQSRKITRNLKHDVEVLGFFKTTENGRQVLEQAIDLYQAHTDRITLRLINPDAPPPGVVKKYAMTSRSPRIVIVGPNDRFTKIKTVTEQTITNALIKVSESRQRKVYFLVGHEEPGIKAKGELEYMFAAESLQDIGYEVTTTSLIETNTVPEDATLVILAGAKKGLFPGEITALANFIDRGGRVMMLLEPTVTYHLEEMLSGFGVELGDNLIVDPNPAARAAGFGPESPVVQQFEPHPITNTLKNVATLFFFARSVQPKIGLEGLTVTTLIQTSGTSWAETQYRNNTDAIRDENDIPGPVPIAVAVQKNTAAVQNKLADAGRLVVFGDHHFAANKFLRMSGNGALFLNAAEWLTGDDNPVTITSPKRKGQHIPLTEMQLEGIMFFSVNLLPLLIIGFGFSVWAIRRRK